MDSYTEPLDTLYWRVRVFLGQGVVTCFLFYSGYGIATAIKKRGDDYVRAMPRRRILPTLFVYDCSQIIFLMVQLSLGKSYSAKDYVLSFLSIKSFGNDNWYIFVILGLYLITWLVLRGRELNKVTAARVSVCALAFCFSCGAHLQGGIGTTLFFAILWGYGTAYIRIKSTVSWLKVRVFGRLQS